MDSLGRSVDSLGRWVDSLGRRVDSIGHRVDSLGFRIDSLGYRVDSLGRRVDNSSLIKDTTYVVYLDSTARLRQFNPVRHDPVAVQTFPNVRIRCLAR